MYILCITCKIAFKIVYKPLEHDLPKYFAYLFTAPPPRPPKALLPCNESGHKERGGEGKGNGSSREDEGDSRQVLEQIAAKSGDHGNEEQVSPDVGEI